MIKAIIFDFDGVIVESVNVKTKAFSRIYRSYGKKIVGKVVAHHLAHGGVSRIEKFRLYHKEFIGVDLTEQEEEQMAEKFSELVFQKVIDAPYVKGAHEFLSEYHTLYDFFVSSGTPTEEIVKIVDMRKLSVFFKGIYGSPEQKDAHVREIMENNNYGKEEIVFVGDAPSDQEAAESNNISFIARELDNFDFLNDNKKIISIKDLTDLMVAVKAIDKEQIDSFVR
tara:strand:+ start:426 stop:1100 length:675 start_codon:yes stop_codon:yes gene_type:complete